MALGEGRESAVGRSSEEATGGWDHTMKEKTTSVKDNLLVAFQRRSDAVSQRR